MALYRATLFFTSNNSPYGWSETYFTSAEVQSDVRARMPVLNFARRGIMHRNYQLEAFRISNENVGRDSNLYQFEPGLQQGLLGAVNSQGEQPFDGLLCRFEAGDRTHASRILRGLPRGVIRDSTQYDPDAAFTTAWDAFQRIFQQDVGIPSVWVLPWRRIEGPQAPITALDFAAGGHRLEMTIAPGPGFIPPLTGASIRIGRVNGMVSANGIWIVSTIVGNVITTVPKALTVYGSYAGGGVMSNLLRGFTAMTAARPQRGVRRDTGRPFDSPVGRRARAR